MSDQVADMIDELLTPGPGNMLTNAREQRGLTTRQVAEQLHLLPRQIEALEANDYHQFNGEIFCKGYLKSYATLLELDPEPLIKAYIDSRPDNVTPIPTAKPRAHIQRPHKGRSVQYWSLAATVVVIGLLWLLGSGGEEETVTVTETPEVVVDKNIAIVDQTEQPSLVEPVADETAELAVAVAPLEVEAQVEAEVDVEPVEVTEPVPVADVAAEESQVAESALNLTFSEDCWVEVKDGSDTMIFADLRRAGSSLELTGEPPFNVLLGYAPGVTMTYNGEPVAVVVNRKKDSARLFVGE
ncbi:helix-turn-helix domain-containing protein [Oceanicoccus sagamiensis]|uniref:Cytoskeleton protein RodZ-like C-terminal domain-containing protein n=1 Tax=Oceanicoccus sagamiensis TaxID=716816 RepID=A0A1X9NER2_9GAMM|nr:RodZ domain-containing protein [Oceanicoccus sagamiensis]ARN76036.1 hypothetical protein BST96_19210 [Oceanicoccus sagamiensis]